MPLILLLNQQLGVIDTGVKKKLGSLGDTLERAANVLQRRRSAFLGAWFGPGLPVDGLSLRATIVNGPELLARIDNVRRMQREYADRRSGPNLVEPIAGLAGVMTGALIGAFATTLAIVGVLAVAAPPVVPVGAVVALASLVTWIGAILRARRLYSGYSELVGAPGARSSGMSGWYEMGAEGAAALGTGIDVGRALLAGPAAATDPLTRGLLRLADRVAALAIRVLGAVATFLSLAPVLSALEAAIVPLQRFAGHLVEIAKAAVTSVVDAVMEGLRRGGLLTMVTLLKRFLPAYVRELHARMRYGVGLVVRPISIVAAEARRLGTGLQTWAEPITTGHPAVVFLKSLGGFAGAVRGIGGRLRSVGARIRDNLMPTSVDTVLTAVSTIHGWISSPSTTPPAVRPPAPPPPPPTPAQALATFAEGGGVTGRVAPTMADLVREELAARPIHVVGTVPRVFPAERERERRAGAAVLQDESFRTARAILRGAATLAGPEIDARVAELESKLAEWEAPLRARAAPLPVRDLPPPRRLVPVVRRLRVVAPGRGDERTVRRWSDDLVAALGRSVILPPGAVSPVPVAAGAR